jgi:hypothetical protein
MAAARLAFVVATDLRAVVDRRYTVDAWPAPSLSSRSSRSS